MQIAWSIELWYSLQCCSSELVCNKITWPISLALYKGRVICRTLLPFYFINAIVVHCYLDLSVILLERDMSFKSASEAICSRCLLYLFRQGIVIFSPPIGNVFSRYIKVEVWFSDVWVTVLSCVSINVVTALFECRSIPPYSFIVVPYSGWFITSPLPV